MSVVMTLRVAGDGSVLEKYAKEHPTVLKEILERGKAAGVLSHRFVANDDEILVIDEWESEEAFQRFFEASPEIAEMMGGIGIIDQPEVKFWRNLDTGDRL